MIDIVFQLLVFFLFTFRIATQEGDFNVKMPLADYQQEHDRRDESPFVTMHVRLRADSGGRLPAGRRDRGQRRTRARTASTSCTTT